MRKVRFIKFFIFIVFILLLLISLSTFLIIYYYPKDKVLLLVTSKAEKVLKRKVAISEINYGLKGIILNDINIYNKEYPNNEIRPGIFASVKNANIRFSLIPLLSKKFIIKKIILNNLKINIYYKDEKSNIEVLLQDIKGNGGSDIETKISSIGLEDAEITLKDSPEILKPLEGTYIFNGNLYLAAKEKTDIHDCTVILPGKRGTIRSDDIGIAITENDFLVNGDFRLDNCSLLWVYTWGQDLNLPYKTFTGNINALKVSKRMVEGFASGKSLLSNSKYANADGKCRVSIANRTVDLLNIEGQVENSKFFINELKFSFSKEVKDKLIKFNISGIDSYIGDLRPVLTFLSDNVTGRILGDISYYKKNYNGKLDLRNVSYISNNKRLIKLNGEVPVIDSNIHIENLPAFIYDQPCTLSISTSGNNFQKIILNIHTEEFKYTTDNISDTGNRFTGDQIQSEITGRVEIDNLYVDEYNLSNIYLNYSFINGILNLNRINSKFMGGNINANGFVDIKSNTPYIDLKLNFSDIKVQEVAKYNDDLAGRFFGTANGNTNIQFGLEKGKNLFESPKAKIEIEIDKGKLVNTGLQKGLSVYLEELKYKLKDIEFNKIYGNLSVLENNCYVNSMIFNSPDVRLKMSGYFIIPTGENKKYPGDVEYVLRFNDYFIQDIPNVPQSQLIGKLVKSIALKKKGGWYIKSFQAKGDDIFNSKNIKPKDD